MVDVSFFMLYMSNMMLLFLCLYFFVFENFSTFVQFLEKS